MLDSCCRFVLVSSFELDGCQHAERGVAPRPVDRLGIDYGQGGARPDHVDAGARLPPYEFESNEGFPAPVNRAAPATHARASAHPDTTLF